MAILAFILNLLLSGAVVGISAWLLPGVTVSGFGTAVFAGLILGLANGFVKPILTLLTWPINLLTLGLFSFVLSALMVLLASAIVPGFKVDGFGWALAMAIVLALVNTLVSTLIVTAAK